MTYLSAQVSPSIYRMEETFLITVWSYRVFRIKEDHAAVVTIG